jgi:hypothetical protein
MQGRDCAVAAGGGWACGWIATSCSATRHTTVRVPRSDVCSVALHDAAAAAAASFPPTPALPTAIGTGWLQVLVPSAES